MSCTSRPISDVPRPQQLNLDAFGRLSVSDPFTLIASKQQTLDDPYIFDTLIINGGDTDFTKGLPHTIMKVKNTGDMVIRQSRYGVYLPSKAIQVFLTGALINNLGYSGVRSRIGYFDSFDEKILDSQKTGDGFYFQYYNGELSIGYRHAIQITGFPADNIDTIIPQSEWNGDKMNGTGKSRLVLDPTARNIFCFQIEFLGVGSVFCYIVKNGQYILCHEFKFSNAEYAYINTEQIAYMSRGGLPCRFEIENVDG